MFLHQASGLYLTENRAYDPYTGRWLSRDPAGEPGGLNLYGYVNDGPINGVDPSGLFDPANFIIPAAIDLLGGVATRHHQSHHQQRQMSPRRALDQEAVIARRRPGEYKHIMTFGNGFNSSQVGKQTRS